MKLIFAFLLACMLAPVHAQTNHIANREADNAQYIQRLTDEIADSPAYRQKVRALLAERWPELEKILPPEPSRRNPATLDGKEPEFIVLGSEVQLGATRLAIWTNLRQFKVGNNSYGSNRAGVTYVNIPLSNGKDYLPRDIVLYGKEQ